eukprot:117462_1
MYDLFYADDDSELAESIEDAQNNINVLINICELAGFEINNTKTKLMKCMKKIKISTSEEEINKYIDVNKNKLIKCKNCNGMFKSKCRLNIHQKMWCNINYVCKNKK